MLLALQWRSVVAYMLGNSRGARKTLRALKCSVKFNSDTCGAVVCSIKTTPDADVQRKKKGTRTERREESKRLKVKNGTCATVKDVRRR